MFVGAGIEFNDKDEVINVIESTLDELKHTYVDQVLLDQASEGMIASIKSLSDFPNSYANFMYSELLGKKSIDLNEMMTLYKSVTLDQVKEVFNRLELDTIYFLKGAQHDLS
jgi:predicted Zn-dependent peptidase